MQDPNVDNEYDYAATDAMWSNGDDEFDARGGSDPHYNNNNVSADTASTDNDEFHDVEGQTHSPPENSYLAEEVHETLNSEEALLDLVQLEEVQAEAERMKALGNKHMAAQEYVQAYNAYSAALQLSPVGPSSHVFLSNRAAALLSIKKYSTASTDARRAIALAPTFGKAHARLGQALYFLKDYNAAIQAYEDAMQFEPDNDVTMAYLQKARSKLEKQQQRKSLKQKGSGSSSQHGEEASNGSMAESTQFSALNSIATDPNARFGVVQKQNYRGVSNTNPVVMRSAGGLEGTSKPSINNVSKPPGQLQQRLSQPHIGIPSSTASVAASALTMDSEENQPRNQSFNAHNNSNSQNINDQSTVVIDDPEFEEAIRIQQRANKLLVQKQYRAAIEEYTAALFLVPDDPTLSPDLHLGRAHALNGSRRHESARNDAILAVKLSPTPAAYSTLAKSLFYMKEYADSIDAFEKCVALLPPGESLGLFDRAYLEKAEKALAESQSAGYESSPNRPQQHQSVPKLPPPRFVPREEAIQAQPQGLRPMPKQWPQQPATKAPPLKCGPEREIMFLSEALGVKLNRGSDGIVRVLSVSPMSAGSVFVRRGDIYAGDIVREAAGVDIRRPITNIMWGDTVALIKMAPRPIAFLVAKELSPVPPGVIEDQKKREQEQKKSSPSSQRMIQPSNAIGDESVASLVASRTSHASLDPTESLSAQPENEGDDDIMEVKDIITHDIVEIENDDEFDDPTDDLVNSTDPLSPGSDVSLPIEQLNEGADKNTIVQGALSFQKSPEFTVDVELSPVEGIATDELAFIPEPGELSAVESIPEEPEVSDSTGFSDPDSGTAHLKCGDSSPTSENENSDEEEDIVEVEDSRCSGRRPAAELSVAPVDSNEVTVIVSNREAEENIVGGEILFLREDDATARYCEWDTLRWMAYSGARKVSFCQKVFRQFDGEKKRGLLPSFWKTGGKRYEPRSLAFYDEPNLILLLRRPTSLEEIYKLLGLPDIAHIEDPDNALVNYWVLESAIDPTTAKLRLSPLTTITSSVEESSDDRDRSCFQILTPAEAIILSVVHVMSDSNTLHQQTFKDSGAYLETLAAETSIAKTLYTAHGRTRVVGSSFCDSAWKHQVVVGSLHSIVLSGNVKVLDEALECARKQSAGAMDANCNRLHLPARVIDAADEDGFTPLYYACKNKMHVAVHRLVNAGATVTTRLEPSNTTLCHLAARNLDHKSLLTLLSPTHQARLNANVFDDEYRTPMYVAATEGSILDGGVDPTALLRCIEVLKERGGRIMGIGAPKTLRHPVSLLASLWLPEYLSAVLDNVPFRYPLSGLPSRNTNPHGMSLSHLYQYPVHFALLTLRKEIPKQSLDDNLFPECRAVRCLRVLFEHGFEPNERIEDTQSSQIGSVELDPFFGFAPIQILAFIALEIDSMKGKMEATILEKKASLIVEIAEFLVRNGARLSVDPPPLKRLRKQSLSDAIVPTRIVDILPRKLDADKVVVSLLGGEKMLEEARQNWNDLKTVEGLTSVAILDNKTTLEDSGTPGGSDSLSCAICWVVFGTIMNRKHKCRITGRFVCEDCSTKRLTQNGTEHRLSDGQFLLSRVDSFKVVQSVAVPQVNFSSKCGGEKKSGTSSANELLNRLESEDQANRDSLFGGFIEKAANYMMGEEDENTTTTKLNGLTSSLGQTRDALNQRGEKLNTLNEKSAQLVDASADFAKMAKELNRQSESGFFW